MARLEWTEAMSVHVAALDLDHQQIVSIIGLFEDAVDEGDAVIAAMLMKSLKQEIAGHFQREETILRAYGFPNLEAHAREHREMLRVLTGFSIVLDAEGLVRASDVLANVKRLFQERLLPDDMEYKVFFEKQGVRPVLSEVAETSSGARI